MHTGNLFQNLIKTKIFIISPHPDDAAFSVGGVIAAQEKPTTIIITTFSKSKAGPGSDAEITSALRAREDDEYAALVCAGLVRLGLPDTSLRQHTQHAPEEAQLTTTLGSLLGSVMNVEEDAAVFVPLGIGGHPDHIHCRQAVTAIFGSAALIFYEDLPYAQFAGGPHAVKEIVNREHPGLSEINVSLTSGQMKKKMNGLDVYKSQLHPQWRKDIEAYGHALGMQNGHYGERYWASPDLLNSIFTN
jgi:LmbE family N-acetylglucosaminyl deacetylase